MKDSRNEYIERIKENLGVLDAKIEVLEAQANEKKGEMRRDYEAVLKDIRESRDKARQRVDELRDASQGAWKDVKSGTDRAWTSLSRAVEQAGKRFK